MKFFFVVIFFVDIISARTLFDKLFVPEPTQCYRNSYNQIDDSTVLFWKKRFAGNEIFDPFGMLIYLIKYFSDFQPVDNNEYLTLNEIFARKRSNKKSSIIAISALMQHLGWDIQYFYDKKEDYFGLRLSDEWKIRKANWIDKEDKRYYLKEFDDSTPVGELKIKNPARTYQGLNDIRTNLKPLPLISSLPKFQGGYVSRNLRWQYKGITYQFRIRVLKEQIEWTKNLPPSLYGMVYSGIEELKNTALIERLKFLSGEFDEYGRVNFLLKFCQSKEVFKYKSGLPIKSVSQQLIEGENDCDGRSVFLYVLLRTVAGYPESSIVFLSWPNHIALGLRPGDHKTLEILERNGFSVDGYFILDPSYCGDTAWGSKMKRLTGKCQKIKKSN